MKQAMIILSLAFLLIGCADWPAAAEETSNRIDIEPKAYPVFENITYKYIRATMHPIAGTNQAGITYELEISKAAAAEAGVDGPLSVYGAGVLTVADEKFTFDNERQFSASGTGNLTGCLLGAPWTDEQAEVCGEPVLSLTAQIDGLRAPAEIEGFGATQNAETLSNIWFNDQEGLTVTQCQGEMIPGTSMGSIIMIGELKDGTQIVGGGLIETDLPVIDKSTPKQFRCAGAATAEKVTSPPEDNSLLQFEIQMALGFTDDGTRATPEIKFIGKFASEGGLGTTR